jgi:hypothetical protein
MPSVFLVDPYGPEALNARDLSVLRLSQVPRRSPDTFWRLLISTFLLQNLAGSSVRHLTQYTDT